MGSYRNTLVISRPDNPLVIPLSRGKNPNMQHMFGESHKKTNIFLNQTNKHKFVNMCKNEIEHNFIFPTVSFRHDGLRRLVLCVEPCTQCHRFSPLVLNSMVQDTMMVEWSAKHALHEDYDVTYRVQSVVFLVTERSKSQMNGHSC